MGVSSDVGTEMVIRAVECKTQRHLGAREIFHQRYQYNCLLIRGCGEDISCFSYRNKFKIGWRPKLFEENIGEYLPDVEIKKNHVTFIAVKDHGACSSGKKTRSLLTSPFIFCVLKCSSSPGLFLLTSLYPTGIECPIGLVVEMASVFLMGMTMSQRTIIPAFQLHANSSWHLFHGFQPDLLLCWLGRSQLLGWGWVEEQRQLMCVDAFVSAQPWELGDAYKILPDP